MDILISTSYLLHYQNLLVPSLMSSFSPIVGLAPTTTFAFASTVVVFTTDTSSTSASSAVSLPLSTMLAY